MSLDFERLRDILPYFVIVFVGYGLYRAYAYIAPTTFLHKLPGPRNGHFLLGNLPEIAERLSGDVHERWAEEYGHVLSYRGFLKVCLHLKLYFITLILRCLSATCAHADGPTCVVACLEPYRGLSEARCICPIRQAYARQQCPYCGRWSPSCPKEGPEPGFRSGSTERPNRHLSGQSK
jgi:hypothetical protein